MGKGNSLDERMKVLEGALKKGKLYVMPEATKEKKKKTKEKKLSNKELYDLTLRAFQFHLYEIICLVNGIDKDIYIDEDSQDLYRNMKLNDTFKSMSKLDWETPAPIDGLRFRGRFLTALLLKAIRKTHDCLLTASQRMEGMKRYKAMNTLLRWWMLQLDSFMITYLSSDGNYLKWLLAIERFLMMETAIDVEKFMKALVETGDTILAVEDPSICVANTTRIAYILATHGAKTKHCPEYNEDYDPKNELDVANQIGQLGYAILRYRKKTDAKLPVLYAAFQKANPEVVSRFYDKSEDKPELTVGLRAMEFSKIFFPQAARNENLVGKMM